jgi:hypothetical protein
MSPDHFSPPGFVGAAGGRRSRHEEMQQAERNMLLLTDSPALLRQLALL